VIPSDHFLESCGEIAFAIQRTAAFALQSSLSMQPIDNTLLATVQGGASSRTLSPMKKKSKSKSRKRSSGVSSAAAKSPKRTSALAHAGAAAPPVKRPVQKRAVAAPSAAGGNAARISSAIDQAMDLKGIKDPKARANWKAGMMTLAKRESTYNPNAVSSAGARGAFQMKPGTFSANHQPGTSSNINDPVAGATASMNYIQKRYKVSNDGSNLASNVQQADPNRKPHWY
jgi:hypothetical protein